MSDRSPASAILLSAVTAESANSIEKRPARSHAGTAGETELHIGLIVDHENKKVHTGSPEMAYGD